MSPFKILFVLFLAVPLVEIYLLIQIGSGIGAPATVLLCIFTAALGAFLLRLQGLHTLASVQSRLDKGEIPATELLSGLILFICGVLLLTPGFFTDTIGFICLVPAIRQSLANGLLRYLSVRVHNRQDSGVVIVEGEYWEEDNQEKLN